MTGEGGKNNKNIKAKGERVEGSEIAAKRLIYSLCPGLADDVGLIFSPQHLSRAFLPSAMLIESLGRCMVDAQ